MNTGGQDSETGTTTSCSPQSEVGGAASVERIPEMKPFFRYFKPYDLVLRTLTPTEVLRPTSIASPAREGNAGGLSSRSEEIMELSISNVLWMTG